MNREEIYNIFTPEFNPSLDIRKEEPKFITKKRGRKNKSNDIINNENFNFEYNKDKKVHTKYSHDNIKKRIKALYNSYIIHLLNNSLKKTFKKIKMRFIKVNIRMTKDIGIEYNRNLLNKKIKDAIINVSNKYKDLDNNKKCIKFIEEQKNNEEILNILNMTYKDLYNDYYLKSTKENNGDNSFEAHKEKILKLYGKEYLDKYIKNTKDFVEFFMNGKNRKCRKPKEVDTIDIPTEENELIKTGSTNDTNLDNLLDNKKQMVSSFAQTEICDINSKLIAIY